MNLYKLVRSFYLDFKEALKIMSRRNGRVYGMNKTVINCPKVNQKEMFKLPLHKHGEKNDSFNLFIVWSFFADNRHLMIKENALVCQVCQQQILSTEHAE